MKKHHSIPKVIFIGGKGGVGKSTMATSLALSLSQQSKVLLISTDPAHNLGDIFERPLNNQITSFTPNLDICEINGAEEAITHTQQVAKMSRAYINANSYARLDEYYHNVAQSASAQESALFERLADLLTSEQGYDHFIVDTAPTGHTLRLFFMPKMLRDWAKTLLSDQERAGFSEDIIGHIMPEKSAQIDQNHQIRSGLLHILEERYLKYQRFEKRLSHESAIIFVLNPEKLPIEETKRAIETLHAKKMQPHLLIINKVLPPSSSDIFLHARIQLQQKYLSEIQQQFHVFPCLAIPLSSGELNKSIQYLHIGEKIKEKLLSC